MKKQILNILVIALVAMSFTACKNDAKNAETSTNEVANQTKADTSGDAYQVKTGDQSISWEGSKPVGTHTGTITLNEGVLYMNKGVITGGKFSIDMKTLQVTDLEAGDGKESLESHLMGTVEGKEDHFFNVEKYPYATFVITSTKASEGMTMLTGDLTIRDKTNPITFPVSISEDGNVVNLKSEQFEIDRTKWGVNYGSKSIFDNLGDKFVDDAMKLKINLYAAK